jgi:hypothetical protein|tara:strand:- start:319 stop:2376 length:2058 start_codon:yes stop_codon:yes gene_type:complete
MAINYFESSNRYTDPVRYFKANDPYYYEVDNIPVKQLEENSNFLKDQIDGLLREQGREFLSDNTRGLDRVRFNELKPTVDGTDSKVRVLPGRYTARINDAYSKDPLQFITQVFTGPNTDETSKYKIGTAKNADVEASLNKWQDRLTSNATLMNGLFERVFVYGMKDIYTASEGVDSNDPNNVREPSTFGGQQSFWPGFIGMINEFAGQPDSEGFYQMLRADFRGTATDENFRITGRLESEFIKRWRGVARTSIVDVSETLEIDIPKFEPEDFFYFDENNNKQTVTANQRIDLVFIYSKAIDQSETSLPAYTAGSPRTITQPTLGILKGAGLGVRKFQDSGVAGSTNPQSRIDLQSIDGVTLMIPNSSDELAENTGFATSAGSVVRGSFPSPDDLMNLAPLLAETLSTNSVALIGQSILPVAYVVVKNDAGLNSVGDTIITDNDVIDIRPFFRTTELAYNERAGIAAATPQLSIANPVVSEAHLDFVKEEIKDGVEVSVQNGVAPINVTLNNLKIQKSYFLPTEFTLPGLDNVRGNTLHTNYRSYDITQAFITPIIPNYKVVGAYFRVVLRQAAETDSASLHVYAKAESTVGSTGSSTERLVALGGADSTGGSPGNLGNVSQFVMPVEVPSNGNVSVDLKFAAWDNGFLGNLNKTQLVRCSMFVDGFIYEPLRLDVDLPNEGVVPS